MHLTFHLTSLLHLNRRRSVNLAHPTSRLHYIHQLSQKLRGSLCSVCIWKKKPHVQSNVKQSSRLKHDAVSKGKKRRFRDLDSGPKEGGRKRLRNVCESSPIEWVSYSTGAELSTSLWEPELSQMLKKKYVKVSAGFIWPSAGLLWTLHSGSRGARYFLRS